VCGVVVQSSRCETGNWISEGNTPRSSSKRGELPRRRHEHDRLHHHDDSLHHFYTRATTMYPNKVLVGDDRDLIPAGGFH